MVSPVKDMRLVILKYPGKISREELYCGYEAGVSGFKLLKDLWKFGFYTVRMLELPNCYELFNYYSGISPRASGGTR